MASYGYLAAIEGGSSIILAIDYLLRLLCCQHNRRYAHMRHGQAHLTWAISPSGLLALVAAYPALSDGHASARDVLIALPRILLLFRTSRWRRAQRAARRVVLVNREILYTSLALVSLTIIISATLLYATCSTEPRCREENGIVDLVSATYWAAMMLTGQASPEGGKGIIAFQAVVLLTAFLSVPFFAVPAAMLTWGFEGEAQRLAAREAERASRRQAYADGGAAHIELESESSDEEDEEYLKSLGGDDNDEAAVEAAGKRALDFFVEQAKALAGGTTSAGAGVGSSLLFPAQAVARRLRRKTAAAARQRRLQRDALELLEKTEEDLSEGLSSADAEALEERLKAFARVAVRGGDAADDGGRAGAHDEDDGDEDVETRLESLKTEMATLRRTTVAGLNELKLAIAELKAMYHGGAGTRSHIDE